MEISCQDLPLPSLNSDFTAAHYLIDLDCRIDERKIQGVVYIFAKQSKPGYKLILDAVNLNVQSASNIYCTEEEVNSFLENLEQRTDIKAFQCWSERSSSEELCYTQDKWSITIDIKEKKATALVVIHFSTINQEEGGYSSIFWTKDENGSTCLLTPGTLINNRALFPHQDAPALFATWQLILRAPESFSVITTGDQPGHILTDDQHKSYFYTVMLLPMSTFALAVGRWNCHKVTLHSFTPEERLIECRHLPYPCPFGSNNIQTIPCQIFSSPSVDVSSLLEYLPACFQVIHSILGRHLVPKIDLVIGPSSLSCLGFTSPGLILLSPSLLYGRTRMLQRVGHELSHSWFGVNIGPKDWNEEWVSEGFATFLEDIIEVKMAGKQNMKLLELKALNRYQILKSDCDNVDPSLQQLSNKSTDETTILNGLNREKTVSQIPYLKGYFFLFQLAQSVGLEELLSSLKILVEQFHGCLISTEDILNFFRLQFTKYSADITRLSQSWLYQTTLPILDLPIPIEVVQHLSYWRRPRGQAPSTFSKWPTDCIIALLDLLLELPNMKSAIVERVIRVYEPQNLNPDAYHRACELIVSSRCENLLSLVRRFLLNHPAMGAYLYGELMLVAERPIFQTVAVECYEALKDYIDPDFRAIVCDLVNPLEKVN